MPPTLVHGVDISALEGWMIKINSNPSVFGKNTSRRWFRVSFVPASNDQKLIISYSTNKTSKEPRGWLYVEDVSGVYCRRDMIEVVSPARTLRFKGETTVEHRLWSDSLHRLCNPPKPEPAPQEKRLVMEEARRGKDRERIADPKKNAPREHVDSVRDRSPTLDEAKPTRRLVGETDSRRQRETSPEDEHGPRRRKEEEECKRPASGREALEDRRCRQENDRDEEVSHATSRGKDDEKEVVVVVEEEEEEEEEEPPRRRQSQEALWHGSRPNSYQRRALHGESDDEHPRGKQPPRREERDHHWPSPRQQEQRHSHDDTDNEEEEEEVPRQAKRDAPLERRPSLLVASIKSLSPCVATPAEPKSSQTKAPPAQARRGSTPPAREVKAAEMSDDDEDEYDMESPQEQTPRAELRLKPVPFPAQEVEKKAPKSTDDFDDDDEEHEDEETNNKHRVSIPTATEKPQPAAATKAPTGSDIRADNNFVEDDWDDDEPDTHSKHKASPEKRASVGFGGVAADSNFATEDWD